MSSIQSHHLGTNQAAGLTLKDELEEPLHLVEDLRTCFYCIVIAGDLDAAVAFARLLFGQPYPGDLWFGEDGEWDALKVHAINRQPACQNRMIGVTAVAVDKHSLRL